MATEALLEASCRVALAAYLHDLGKFAERANIAVDKERLQTHLQLYAKRQEAGGRSWYSHRHAAYTALAWELIERQFPELLDGDVFPFKDWTSRDIDDSVVNAAAMHHKPESFLQWVVATADRVASGFEREEFEKYNNPEESKSETTRAGKNHITARQFTLFEQIRLETTNEHRREKLNWRYPLAPLSPVSIFPVAASVCESDDKHKASAEYLRLWEVFQKSLAQIPDAHRRNWSLWLDHFDSAWASFTHAIPAATAFNIRPEVSLYDHSKTTAALATAIWRYHHDLNHDLASVRAQLSQFHRPDWDEQKLLLVQGDLFGIQNFLFAAGGESQKKAAKLLRGRSFYVSLLTECAGLRILEALSLPPTSQIWNAAGKFLIVAPNTPEVIAALQDLRTVFDQWFLQHTYGQAGLGIAWIPAACNDFLRGRDDEQSPFAGLTKKLFESLHFAKSRRFDLCGDDAPPAIFDDFLDSFEWDRGVCSIDGVSPAKRAMEGAQVSDLAADQIAIGSYLASRQRLLISSETLKHNSLRIPLFDYYIQFTGNEEASGQFSTVARDGTLRRAWDYSIPLLADEAVFAGYARRFINGYVPKVGILNEWEASRYDQLTPDAISTDPKGFKTLEMIACDDRKPVTEHSESFQGVEALVTLKGDVDNLGRIFQSGMESPSFAKLAALSRQMNAFFSIWLPSYCQKNYPSTYTVFAGGDDFFLIGPWHSTLKLAGELRLKFGHYVAGNPEIHLSAGLSMTRPGFPIRQLGEYAERSLDAAKSRQLQGEIVKDGVNCFGFTLGWSEFEELLQLAAEMMAVKEDLNLSTSYLYGLQHLADMSEDLKNNHWQVESALWNSRFAYRTRRMLEKNRDIPAERYAHYQMQLGSLLGDAIRRHGGSFRVALYTLLYQYRN